MVQGADLSVLQAHTKAVGEKAAGYVWWTRISRVYLDLIEFNETVRLMSLGSSLAYRKEMALLELQRDLNSVIASGGSQEVQEEFRADISKIQDEIPILKRLDAAVGDSQVALGTEFSSVVGSLRIRDLSPRHAFRTATKKLELQSESESVNYLIRMVSDEGDSQERHIIKEVKDAQGKVLEFECVARLLYQELKDAYGNVTGVVIPTIVKDEAFTQEACSTVQAIFKKEISGASSTRFKTALNHLTRSLQSIPLSPGDGVHYCGVSKAPVVSLIRELVRWVDFKFKTSASEGCRFLAFPLLGGDEVELEIVQAANTHLEMRLAESIAAIQAIRKERSEIPEDESSDVRESKEKALMAREMTIRREVSEIQVNVKSCLEGLHQQSGVLQQGSKVLLKEYASLLGV